MSTIFRGGLTEAMAEWIRRWAPNLTFFQLSKPCRFESWRRQQKPEVKISLHKSICFWAFLGSRGSQNYPLKISAMVVKLQLFRSQKRGVYGPCFSTIYKQENVSKEKFWSESRST